MSLLKAFHGSPSFISSLPSTYAHLRARTHTHTRTESPAAPPKPLTLHQQHPDPIAWKQGVKQADGRGAREEGESGDGGMN